MQGIFYKDTDDKLDDMDSDFLCDLAGNAFHSGCVASVVLAVLVVLARSHKACAAARTKQFIEAAVARPSEPVPMATGVPASLSQALASPVDRSEARNILDSLMAASRSGKRRKFERKQSSAALGEADGSAAP